ncbi:hypothetical protein Q4595_04120 [Wenyingzhuangia sp. 1_MG-2023]|nr:hypothetical protein [Wenyingzhuangia sp. 1_MG-2023]
MNLLSITRYNFDNYWGVHHSTRIANIHIIDNRTNQITSSIPVTSHYVFEYIYYTIWR